MNTIEAKIYYEDTDCGNVVYYANYLKYMERGRTEFLADHGFSVSELAAQDTIFIVARVEINYRSPAQLGETVVIKTGIEEMTRTSLLFVTAMTDKTSGRLLADATAKLVCVNASARIKRIPPEIIEKLKPEKKD